MLRLRGSKWFFNQMTHAQPLYFSRRILPKGEDDVKLYWQCPDLELGHWPSYGGQTASLLNFSLRPSRPLR
jgi:hypothetical protein